MHTFFSVRPRPWLTQANLTPTYDFHQSFIGYCGRNVVLNMWSSVMKDLNSYHQLHQRWELHAKCSSSRVVLLNCSHVFHPDRHSHVCPILPCTQSLPLRFFIFEFSWISACPLTVSPRRYISHQITGRAHVKVCHCGMNVSNLINGTGN